MKKLLSLMLALLLLCPCFAVAEDEKTNQSGETETLAQELTRLLAENEALKKETEALKTENERLSALVASYADPSVIVAFDGGSVSFDEVYSLYLETLEYYGVILDTFGYDYEEAEMALELQTQIAINLSDSRIIDIYLEKNQIRLLSDEEYALISADAQAQYEQTYLEAYEFYLSEGYDEAEAKSIAGDYISENGLDAESLKSDAIIEAESERLTKLLTGDIKVTDEDIKTVYERYLELDREYYTEYPEEFGYDALYSDAPLCFVPNGYRTVKMVVIPFDEEAMSAYDELYMRGKSDGEEANRLYEALFNEANRVYERLLSGESFDQIRLEYPETEFYMDELGREEGFYLSFDSYIFDEETVDAIMSLMTVGSVTRPIRNDWGYAIFLYAGDLEGGEVSFDEVKDALYDIALESKTSDAYETALEELRQNAHAAYFFDRLN